MSNEAFYNRLASTAKKLLKDKGQAVTITTVTPGTYDPTKGTVTNPTTTQYGYGAVMSWDVRNIDGSLILATDKRLLLSSYNAEGGPLIAPKLGDTVTDAEGKIYAVVQPLKPLSPAGMAVLFECNLRA